jgi:hypothetical protein
VWFSSILVSVRLFHSSFPLTFPVAEYADMIYVYGFCGDNGVHDVPE